MRAAQRGGSRGNSRNGRKRRGYTHFVSIPLATQANVGRMRQFKGAVLGFVDGKDHLGIDSSVFMQDMKLHFTLLMLSLENDAHVQEACDVVRTVVGRFAKERGSELVLNCKGLDVFPPGKAEQARVLFTKIADEDTEALDTISDLSRAIALEMRSKDLFADDSEMERALTKNFHATLMNYRYKSSKEGAANDGPASFNVAQLIEMYGPHFELEPVTDIEVTVSSLRKKAPGYYYNEVSVPLKAE